MTVITLTTDFGDSPVPGQIRGVILSTAPGSKIVDLSHFVPQGDCLAAQIVLEDAAPFFPDGVVHLVMIDTAHFVTPEIEPAPSSWAETVRPLAARLGPQAFVGPDTGLITPLLEQAEANRWMVEIYHASKPEYWGAAHPGGPPEWAAYAALAAHLARGVPPAALGERINDPQRTAIPEPELTGGGWSGEVIQVDHFGNLMANIKALHLEGMGAVQVAVGGVTIQGLSRTFGDGHPGELIALIDSSNRLSISVVNGSAAEHLGVRPKDRVTVLPARPQ